MNDKSLQDLEELYVGLGESTKVDMGDYVHSLKILGDLCLGMVVLLDENCELIYANDAFVSEAKQAGDSGVHGWRVGHALGCVKRHFGSGGCGQGRMCPHCGLRQTVLKAMGVDHEVTGEGYMVSEFGREYMLSVRARRVRMGEGYGALVFLREIDEEKKTVSVERALFHEVDEMVCNVMALAKMTRAYPVNSHELIREIEATCRDTHEKIGFHRELDEVLSGEFEPQREWVQINSLLYDLRHNLMQGAVCWGKEIKLTGDVCSDVIETDRRLLMHALRHLMQNALETTPVGGSVSIAVKCNARAQCVCFAIHNDQAMERKVQAHIFERFFSTKGKGRGMGVYGTKVLVENGLHGRVRYKSSEDEGTTFYVELPYGTHEK